MFILSYIIIADIQIFAIKGDHQLGHSCLMECILEIDEHANDQVQRTENYNNAVSSCVELIVHKPLHCQRGGKQVMYGRTTHSCTVYVGLTHAGSP